MGDPIARLSTALADRYLIERELGAGGMATVYLAHDIRHDREVALKVLRPELASILGAERFLAEIKTTAHLQHPHILPLHDSGEADGLVFYVMPYVEGESLRDRLNREGQLPVEEAVRIATEVAGALDYAHRHGVVHRDIKPENILLEEGQALVADFGIALAVHTAGAGTRITETGMSLGTPHYMAPEQAMGQKEITPKADVYALGCVLYEMLTAEPPFTGPTAQVIVARVMTEQPRALTLQRHTIPRHVEAAVLRALEKLPADRFASAAEFAAALANPSFTSAGATTSAAGALAPRRRDWRSHLAVPMTVVAAAMAAAAAWAYLRPAPTPPVHRYAITLPEQQAPRPDRPFALSPDGSHLVYVGPGDSGTQLWVKARERFDATPLPGTAGVYNFTFSPDGQWLAYVQNGQLKKVPVIGGAAITVADSVSDLPGLAWLDDGSLVYVQLSGQELRRIRDVGGPSTVVFRSDSAYTALPTPLPRARGVLFTLCRGGCTTDLDVWVLDLRSGAARRLLTGAVMGWYVPTGHVIYVRLDGRMLAVPFDRRTLQVRGSPVPVLDNVSVIYPFGPLAAVSSEGTLITRPGALTLSLLRYEMVWVDRLGRQTPVDSSWRLRHALTGSNPGWSLSPDGKRLAIGLSTDAGSDIWIKQLPRGPLSRVSFDSGSEYRPRWSPDGRWVDYVGMRGGRSRIYRKRADGTGSEELVLALPEDVYEVARTRDGQWLVTRAGGEAGRRDILVQHLGVDSVARPLLASPAFDEAAAALSPDGHWIAYETNETGRNEVYVRPFPNVEAGKWQVSANGGHSPLWSRSGRELFFVDLARNLVAVPVAAGPVPHLGERRTLFRLGDDIYSTAYYTASDIAADGRFLMTRVVRAGAPQVAPLIVVENWFEELKQKLGKR